MGEAPAQRGRPRRLERSSNFAEIPCSKPPPVDSLDPHRRALVRTLQLAHSHAVGVLLIRLHHGVAVLQRVEPKLFSDPPTITELFQTVGADAGRHRSGDPTFEASKSSDRPSAAQSYTSSHPPSDQDQNRARIEPAGRDRYLSSGHPLVAAFSRGVTGVPPVAACMVPCHGAVPVADPYSASEDRTPVRCLSLSRGTAGRVQDMSPVDDVIVDLDAALDRLASAIGTDDVETRRSLRESLACLCELVELHFPRGVHLSGNESDMGRNQLPPARPRD